MKYSIIQAINKLVTGVFMKKAMCILLSVIMVISLSGCTSNTPVKELVSDIINEAHNPLKKIDLSELGSITIVDYSSNDEFIAILYTPVISEEQLDENYVCKTFLTVYDIKKDRLKDSIEVAADAFDTAFSGDNIQVWNDDKVSVLYDTQLNKIKNGEGKYYDIYDIAQNVDTIDTSRFVCRESYAYDSYYIKYEVMVFYDEPDKYYINERSNMTSDISSCEKIVFNYTDVSDNEITLNVIDYENMTRINSLTMKAEGEYFGIAGGIISEKYAIFETMKDGEEVNSLYCWSYKDDSVNTPFECIVVNDSEVDDNADTVCARIKDNYGINTVLSKSLPYEKFNYNCVDSKTDAQYLLTLYDLEYCLSTFPKQMYDEMLCTDIADTATPFNRQNIYIVGEIDDDNSDTFAADAFANNMNDELNIVYSCAGFTYSTFCHELMHNMEYRIWNCEPDFDDKWQALNPDDFFYTSEYSDVYSENENYQDYFARDYGASGILEDRATVFEMYYNSKHNKSEPWWQEHEPLNKKVTYLNEVVAKSYPSLSDKT